jgi:hypothetical protein
VVHDRADQRVGLAVSQRDRGAHQRPDRRDEFGHSSGDGLDADVARLITEPGERIHTLRRRVRAGYLFLDHVFLDYDNGVVITAGRAGDQGQHSGDRVGGNQ